MRAREAGSPTLDFFAEVGRGGSAEEATLFGEVGLAELFGEAAPQVGLAALFGEAVPHVRLVESGLKSGLTGVLPAVLPADRTDAESAICSKFFDTK